MTPTLEQLVARRKQAGAAYQRVAMAKPLDWHKIKRCSQDIVATNQALGDASRERRP